MPEPRGVEIGSASSLFMISAPRSQTFHLFPSAFSKRLGFTVLVAPDSRVIASLRQRIECATPGFIFFQSLALIFTLCCSQISLYFTASVLSLLSSALNSCCAVGL